MKISSKKQARSSLYGGPHVSKEVGNIIKHRAKKSEFSLSYRLRNAQEGTVNGVLSFFGNKKAVLGIVLIVGIVGGAIISSGPAFHSYTVRAIPCDKTTANAIGAYCHDPTSLIWGSLPTDLADFNSQNAVFTSCIGNSNQAGNNCLRLAPNSTNTAVAITKNTVDLSIASGKTIALLNANWMDSQVLIPKISGQGNTWGYYLTTSGTVPNTLNYNPLNDPTVVYEVQVFCDTTNGCSSLASNSTTFYGTKVLMLKTLGQNDTIAGELQSNCPGGPYSSAVATTSSCFLGAHQNNLSANNVGGFATSYLNFTGTTNAAACTVISNVLTGGGCSWLVVNQQTTNNNPTVLATATTQIPWLKFQSQQYHIGFFAGAGLGNWNYWSFNGQQFVGCCNMDTFTYNSSPAVSTPPNIDTGGFFGPVIQALINIGISVLQNIFQFFGFLWTVLQSALNSLGSFLGIGAIGTQITNAFSDFSTWVGSIFSTGFTIIGNGITFLVNSLSAITNTINTYWGLLNSFLSDLAAFLGGLWSVLGAFLQYGSIASKYGLVLWWSMGMAMWYRNLKTGMMWARLSFMFILYPLKVALFFYDHIIEKVLLHLKQLVWPT